MTIDVASPTDSQEPDLTAAQAFDLQDQLTTWTPESDDDKTSRRSLQSTLTARFARTGGRGSEQG